MRRAGRPGLIGLAARTAVVAGTANAVNARAAGRHQAAAQQQEFAAAAQQAQIDAAAQQAAAQAQARAAAAPPAPAPAPAAPAVDIVGELQKLGALKEAGLLDDAEFAAAKARLLA
ncbi:MAG: hypothetical protein ABS63_00740 [Microbacterium sp. SCN 70-27]|uniref:SHOCT domain-containing protein n=1 Tax=unclassified Microbacterium TaxID=2609290 RepID=UPI00086AF78E|nr:MULTISPECIES: SHOCT domain-containing protein [unclassified Microbacterium]MBN9225148.1 SHOCT domain-containing protein [Microbacterium sp.]ODT29253.1 MAG: hypothetical protein ABS63_00740 [Microbacterium sp. SCN 70-27]